MISNNANLRLPVGLATQLFRQGFHGSANSPFRSAVWHQILESHKTSHGRESDDVTAVVLDHLGQKCLEHPEVRDKVDVDNLSNLIFGVFEHVMLRHDSSIVHENGNSSNLLQHLTAGFQHLLPVGHINTKIEWHMIMKSIFGSIRLIIGVWARYFVRRQTNINTKYQSNQGNELTPMQLLIVSVESMTLDLQSFKINFTFDQLANWLHHDVGLPRLHNQTSPTESCFHFVEKQAGW